MIVTIRTFAGGHGHADLHEIDKTLVEGIENLVKISGKFNLLKKLF